MKALVGTMALAAMVFGGCENMNRNNAPNRMTGPTDQTDRMRSGELSMADQNFIMDAASGGMYELKSSQLALEKTRREDLKPLAQQMITDHTKVSDQLKGLAQKHGLTLSDSMNQNHQGMFDRLSRLDGAAFDNEYLKQQTTAHREAVSKFLTETREGSAEDVKQWAHNTLPTLQHHLDMVQAKVAPQTPKDRDNAVNPEMK